LVKREFSLINAAGVRFWVKFHHLTRQGIANNTSAEAIRLAGED
jgi:catalase